MLPKDIENIKLTDLTFKIVIKSENKISLNLISHKIT